MTFSGLGEKDRVFRMEDSRDPARLLGELSQSAAGADDSCFDDVIPLHAVGGSEDDDAEGRSANVVGTALVVLVSDHESDKTRRTGDLLVELLHEADMAVDAVVVVPSDEDKIRQALETGVVGGVDLVLTVGGVGATSRDVVPEVTREVVDRPLPGIAEALRSSGLAAGAIDACISRGLSGISGSTLVINIAGSRGAIRDGMATLGPLARYVITEISAFDGE